MKNKKRVALVIPLLLILIIISFISLKRNDLLLFGIRNESVTYAKIACFLGADPNLDMSSSYEDSDDTSKALKTIINKNGGIPILFKCLNIKNTLIQKEMLDVLLQHEGNINITDYNGMTALMWASRSGNIEITRYFLSNGADVLKKDKYGNDARSFARENGNKDLIDILNN